MSRDKTIYWTTTGVVCSVMVFSAINFNLEHPLGRTNPEKLSHLPPLPS